MEIDIYTVCVKKLTGNYQLIAMACIVRLTTAHNINYTTLFR